ncbi:MAG: ABC-2 family transporter protein [Bacteroidetes bacterium]|nr:ABC-2 family transporter protein [Bacteroidota bacterium]
MDLAYHLSNIFIFKIIFSHTTNLAGWTEEQAIVFIASYILCDGLYMSFFANNCWWFPVFINKGELDYYLTRPVSPLFFLSLREFAANSFINLLFAIGIFTWAITNYSSPFSISQLLAYIFLIINGVVIYYILHMLFYLPVFWTQSPRGFEGLLYGLDSIMKYPDKIQNLLFRYLFTLLIPLNLIISFPAKLFFGEDVIYNGVLLASWTIVFWSFFLWIWSKALKQYSSASS